MSRQEKTPTVAQAARDNALRLVGMQFIFALIVTGSWALVDLSAAFSAAIGAVACILPNLYFARRFFASAALLDPQKILRRFYLAELIKLLLSAVLIALALSLVHVNILAFFTGFLGAHMGFWVAPLLVVSSIKGSD